MNIDDMLSIQSIELDEQDYDYNSLEDKRLLEVIFGYVETGIPTPSDLLSVCKARGIYEIVEPLLGVNDVEEIMEEIDETMY